MDGLTLLSQRDNIEEAFKSLIKSGRPDIRDDENKNLLPQLYVDLFENDYFLKQALDENHAIFKGRRGTGKSTIFLQAEEKLKEKKGVISVYINLQSCYEEIRTSNSEEQELMNKYNVYLKFFNQILEKIKNDCKKIFQDKDIEKLFEEIKNGEYIDENFRRTMQFATNSEKNTQFNLNANTDKKAEAGLSFSQKNATEEQYTKQEMRIFSINTVLNKMKKTLDKHSVAKVYLFLDDFSELAKDSQKLIVDSLIAPIISSYNDVFVIKLAAYPYRIYLGNIDSSKIVSYSLDFYDVYEKTSTNYKNVEASGIDYIKRTLKKRISVYTNEQLDADDIFDTAKEKIDIYYKTLFYASAGIPRSLGYILKYSFLNSINKGNGITIADLDNASKTYFVNNILADFCNDSRYKESFFDENKILTQMTQKKLMDDLIEMAKTIKRGLIEKYTGKQSIKDIYKQTIEKNKSGITYWLPTSHFYIDKEIESILQTLELYYIVSKFNEGSSRKPGIRVSYYGLNYGLCLENQIDYGKPEFRRAYDYWRQDEFDYTDFIPAAINAVEVPKCSNCGYEYKDKAEYEVAKKFGFCLNCQEKNCIQEVNQLEEIMKEQIAKWKSESLPDIEIDILRVLYNNRQHEMSAVEIGNEVDRHHLAITKIMEKLSKRGYVSYVTRDKRYYSIKEKAISIFFNDVMETVENENS